MPKFINWREVKAKGVPFSIEQAGRLEAEGGFPKRIVFGVKTHRWLEAEIDAWMDQKLARDLPRHDNRAAA